MDVSTSASKDRIGAGTGLWRLIPADDPKKGVTPKKFGDSVENGDTFYLQNFYGPQGYLDSCGARDACVNPEGDDSTHNTNVNTSLVRHRDPRPTAIWRIVLSGGGTLSEQQEIRIQSLFNDTYLDTCGGPGGPAAGKNLNNVSTYNAANRDSNSTTWHFEPYDHSIFEDLLSNHPDVESNQIHVVGIQCVVPSSGAAASAVTPIMTSCVGLAGAAAGTTWTPTSAGPPPAAAPSSSSSPSAGMSYDIVTASTANVVGQLSGNNTATGSVGALTASGPDNQLTNLTSAVSDSVSSLQAAHLSSGGVYFPPYVNPQPGSAVSDQISIKLDGNDVIAKPKTPIKAGDCILIDVRRPRGAGNHTIEIWGLDEKLTDDLLFQYTIPQDAEFVNRAIAQSRPEVGASYILYLTATKGNTGRRVLSTSRQQLLKALY